MAHDQDGTASSFGATLLALGIASTGLKRPELFHELVDSLRTGRLRLSYVSHLRDRITQALREAGLE